MRLESNQLPVGHAVIEARLRRPVTRVDLNAERERLHQQETWRRGLRPSSITLVKHADLRIVLVAMRAGQDLDEHRTAARLSLHLLSGSLSLELDKGGAGRYREMLNPGQMLALDHDLPYRILATSDSDVLLTVAWTGHVL